MISFRHIAKQMDPIRPPNRFKGTKTAWLDMNPNNNLFNAETKTALSLFPIRPEVGLWHQLDKGLLQMYRYPPLKDPKQNGQYCSFKNIAKRHLSSSSIFSMLWLNTWLLNDALGASDKPLYEQRTIEIGKAIAKRNYHIVGLCEVFGKDLCIAIADQIKVSHSVLWERGSPGTIVNVSSGLMNLAIDKVTFQNVQRMAFDNDGGGSDSWAQKGVLYTEMVLQLPNSQLGYIDLFTTHTHSEEADTRKDQLNELYEFVNKHRKITNPLIIAGDININNRSLEYVDLINGMAKLDCYDIWLSRGGYAGATDSRNEHTNDYTLACLFNPDSYDNYCIDYPNIHENIPESIPGDRLDYIFVEQPKEHHNILIDIPRIRRQPFWRNIGSVDKFWNDNDEKIPNFMSDHIGLEMDLIVTPMSQI